MSSVREPAIDVQARTLVSASDRQARGEAAAVPVGEDRTQAAGPVEGRVEGAGAEVAELEPGAVIARYRIIGKLGAGGMGVVYRAHDAQLDREVALKLLRVGEDGTEGRTRMLREAKAAAKIRHANVVTVYDAGEAFGRVFIAMELIDGITLKAHFRGRRRGWREVVEVMLGAGEGLAAAHAVGLVHRDFKPDNVLVEVGGRVRVLDFGLARPAIDVDGPTVRSGAGGLGGAGGDTAPILRTLTQTGTLVGTPAYMAPEQHLARAVDARSDQFAFCVTCFECLYGQRPFAGDTQAELTMNVVDGRLLAPRERGDAPMELLAALQRGLSVHPADRYPALADLLTELRAIVRRHEPRDRKGLMIAAGLMLPLIAGAALYVGSEPETPAQVVPPTVTETTRHEEVAPPVEALTPTPKPVGMALGQPKHVDAAALAELLGEIVPKGMSVTHAPEGLFLAGDRASRWKGAAELLLATIDGAYAQRTSSLLLTQVPTPDGSCGVYLLEGEDFAARVKAIHKLPGATRVGSSLALGVVLAIGDKNLPDAVKKLVREAKAPKFRGWYFINDKMGDQRMDFPTLAACETEEAIWYSVKGRCKGVK
ncbi:MAG: serine/threonine protein kinase [Nannocystis sp.]|uniref:serine/threonine-protein kinase n=1 Tax=Nannocystis sp. TaxID=1962667 RepID=UPI002426B500|nr:serine/threonine-protein kinase [Nannocystis sp.]MBK9754192.1 serine/threonine protein kinase [Nannocystis sp.]